MEIKEVSLRKTYNMGNYQSMSVELKASIDKDEDPQKVIKELKEQCELCRRAEEV